MVKYLGVPITFIFSTILMDIYGNDSKKAQETLPFLKGEYVYEYLRESKTKMSEGLTQTHCLKHYLCI